MFATLNPVHLDLLHALYAGGLPPSVWAAVDDARAYRRSIDGMTHTVLLAYITEFHPVGSEKPTLKPKRPHHKDPKTKLLWEAQELTFIYLGNKQVRYVRGFPGHKPLTALRFASKALQNAAAHRSYVWGQE